MALVLGGNSILHHLWAPVRQKYGNSDGAFGRLCCDGKSCKGKCITLAIPRPSVPRIACTYDWTGGFIKNDDSADDVRDIDLSIVHFLSGPVGVRGAKPGGLLVVDLLDIGARPDSQWGFNGFFSKTNGGRVSDPVRDKPRRSGRGRIART
ncbi:acetamidase/formamidase family protein, partial [Pandoraea nosoerga]|uniref:acetamidase/formamidase family protein n=1 Tax=Pandoraea nosoerga TaxID=2508296 RepID=UPI001F119DB9